jgi:dienelactone hydrolase
MEILTRAVDRGVAVVQGMFKMFSHGWGDDEVLDQLVDEAQHIGPPRTIDIRWRRGKRSWRGHHIFRGWFQSPTPELPLPPASRAAYVEMLLPSEPFSEPRPAMAVHLAGTGDATFAGRRQIAKPLLDRGIGAVILENPYYGYRKPPEQFGTILRKVEDQIMMNLATVEEARAILDWLRREGFELLGTTGYSMGGFMSSFTAASMPYPVAATPCASGDSAVPTLLHSPLSSMVDWERLAEDTGSVASAKARMGELLDKLAMRHFDPPVMPEAAIIMGTNRDEFIPTSQPEALHKHWKGSELRWIEGGHTSGWALHGGKIRDGVFDSFFRLRQKRLGW